MFLEGAEADFFPRSARCAACASDEPWRRGQLSIAILLPIGELLLPPAIGAFRERFPRRGPDPCPKAGWPAVATSAGVVWLGDDLETGPPSTQLLGLLPQEPIAALIDRRIDIGFVPLTVVEITSKRSMRASSPPRMGEDRSWLWKRATFAQGQAAGVASDTWPCNSPSGWGPACWRWLRAMTAWRWRRGWAPTLS
jgi:hypothetical protein